MKNKSNLSLSLRKVILSALVAAPLATLPAPLWALPGTTSANVTSSSGTTTFQTVGSVLNITDPAATRLVLRWNEFGGATTNRIDANETVIWNLPSSSSAVLNTVTTGATIVNGALQSNGSIYILNPNGITLNSTATVSAQNLGLSTVPEAEFYFLANGTLSYAGTATSGVIVRGTGTTATAINVGTTGSVFINGKTADVSGVINAGTLNVTTQNGLVRLGVDSVLDLGADGNSSVNGTGNLVVNTTGGNIEVAKYASVTVRGGNATLTTGGGTVTQGTGNWSNTAVTLTNTGGVGYTSVPNVAVSAPNVAGGTQATAVATIDTATQKVTGVTFTNRGSGYNAVPTLTITGGGATTDATATVGAPVVNVFEVGDNQRNSTLTINTAGTTGTPGAVTLTNISRRGGDRVAVNLTSGATSITSATRMGLGNSTVTGNLAVSAGGAIDSAGSVTVTNGTISLATTAANSNINFTGVGDLTFASLQPNATGSSVTLTSTTGAVVLPAATISGNATVTAQTNITQTGGLVVTGATQTASFNAVTGSVTLTNGANDFNRLSITNAPSGATVSDMNGLTIAGGTNASGNVIINATNGNIAFGTASDNSITFGGNLTLNTGSLVGAPAVTNGGNAYSAAPTVTISAPNLAGGVQATATATVAGGVITGINITNAGTGYTSTPTVTITDATGTGATATLALGGTLGTITDATNNITVVGALTAAARGDVALDGAASTGVGVAHRFGQINASAPNVRVYELSTLNLGSITTAGVLRAYSTGGDIVNTGNITGGGAVQVGAGTAAAPGNITLNSAGNAFGALTVLDDFTILSNAAVPGGTIGSYLARDLTVNNAATITLGQISSTSNTGIAGNLSLTATGAGNDISVPNTIRVGGTVTLSAPDDVSASDASNAFANVSVTAGGVVNVRSASNLTAAATLTQNAAGRTALIRSEGTLTLGAVNSDYTGLVTFEAGSNGTSALSDSVAGMRLFGPVFFNSAGSVTINRSGHSFGQVAITAANNRNATIIESGTLRLGNVSLLGGSAVSFSATSTTGDIIQDTAANGIGIGNTSSSVTLSASQGNITLNDNVGTVNAIIGRINATAAGNVTIAQNRATALGNITAGGFLTVDLTGTANNGISQASGSRLNVFDTVTLNTSGSGAISLNATGNRLGGVIATTGTGNVTLVENTTLNLLSVITTGTLTATSEAGNIMDSTRTGVAANYIAGNTATPGTTAIGAATFSAPNGNVNLTLSGSNYSSVGFTTTGNVAITDGFQNTTLSTSTIGGTLDVTNLAAGATIGQSGVLKVTGNVAFTTNAGGIVLSNSSNEFGAIRFVAGAPGVILTENTTLNLRGGSISTGPVQFNTNADFVTSGPGGSSFTNNLTISALGTIIPSAGSLLVTGTFQVFSPSTKDLSALSKSGNLANRDPVNVGTGTYVPPSP